MDSAQVLKALSSLWLQQALKDSGLVRLVSPLQLMAVQV